MSQEIVGTWALVQTTWRRADGRHANPFGDQATGMLVYTADGYMSAQVMRASRPLPPEGTHTGIDTAMASAFAGYIAYFGTYDVDDRAVTVTHHVIGAAFPGWVGADVTRRFAIDAGRLTLTDSVVATDGVPVEASTTWERIG